MLGKIRSNETSVALVIGAVGFLLQGCLAPSAAPAGSTASASTATTTTTTAADATVSGDLYFKVQRSWEDQTDKYDVDSCVVAPNTADPTNDKICHMAVPEAEMHYSNFSFTYGTSNPAACKIVTFRPYSYQLSVTDAAFLPPVAGATATVDCTASPIPLDCYNGVAKELVSGFPLLNSGVYILSEFTAESTVTTAMSPNQLGLANNRYIANDYSTPGVAIAGEYVINSMKPYMIECRDEFYELQQRMYVYISDIDGPTDHFKDWN